MKRRSAVLSVVVVSVLAVAAQVDVSGTWSLEMRWPGDVTSTGTCELRPEGDALTGTCGAGAERFPVRGRIDGRSMSLDVEITPGRDGARMSLAGKVDEKGATVSGLCRAGEQEGSFTMTRAAGA